MPSSVQPNVEFWSKVFTQYNSKEAILHDENDLSIIYDVITLSGNKSLDDHLIQDRIHDIKVILQAIAEKNFRHLPPKELDLLDKIPRPRSINQLRLLKDAIHMQQGLSDKFRQSLIRSGKYLPMIRRVFKQYHLPLDLAYLPHVESSFLPQATSKYGAAGLWQFTYSTGKSFLTISYAIDERRDPERSTLAAAKLLLENFKTLKTWPLAITAYNHGAASLKRISEMLGTRDIQHILKYRGGAFGFASRNFYPSFLAARYVANHATVFFPDIQYAPELKLAPVTLPKEVLITDLTHAMLPLQTLKDLNPALSNSVLQGYRHIPKGTRINIPPNIASSFAQQMSAQSPSSKPISKGNGRAVPSPLSPHPERTEESAPAPHLSSPRMRGSTPIAQSAWIPGQARDDKEAQRNDKSGKPSDRSIAKTEPPSSAENFRDPFFRPEIFTSDISDDIVSPSLLEDDSLLRFPENPHAIVSRYGFHFLKPRNSPHRPDVMYIKSLPGEKLLTLAIWGKIPMEELLQLNTTLLFQEDLGLGTQVFFPQKYADTLHAERVDFYTYLASDYLSTHTLTFIQPVTLETSTTLTELSQQKKELPIWLLLMFNPKLFSLPKLFKGEVVYHPVIESSSPKLNR